MINQSILEKFGVEDIIAFDTEYSPARKGNHVLPLCIGAKSLVTGERYFSWHKNLLNDRWDNSAQANARPAWLAFSNDNILWVTYSAPAEWGYALAAGYCGSIIDLPTNIVDLYAEDALRVNGRKNTLDQKAKAKLIFALHRNGIPDPYEDKKERLQKLIGNCEDFSALTAADLAEIEIYQMQDVDMHAELFLRMEPDMNAAQALNRGDYSRVTACYEWAGVPADVDTAKRLMGSRIKIQDMAIREMEEKHHFGVYEFDESDGQWHWSHEKFSALVHARGLQDLWPKTPAGLYCIGDPDRGSEDKKVFKSMCRHDPYFEPLRVGRSMAGEFKGFSLPIGDDNRVRATNLPFDQKTMRSSPHGGSIFAMDARNRWLIQSPPGRSNAYIDLSSCEFVVAAAMSGDKNMLKICDEVRADPTKNVYVEIMKAAGVAKPGDTKKTVGPAYKAWKIGGLATLYGQEAAGLAKNLNIPFRTAKFIHDFFHEHFATYWRYIGNKVIRGQSRGFMETLGGWRLDTRYQKLTTLKNFPVQSNACEILHLGAVKMVDSGCVICTTVHDAVLLEAPTSEIAECVRIAQECFKEAGLEIVGYPMSSDSYIFNDRFEDEDGEAGWITMLDFLERAERESQLQTEV